MWRRVSGARALTSIASNATEWTVHVEVLTQVAQRWKLRQEFPAGLGNIWEVRGKIKTRFFLQWFLIMFEMGKDCDVVCSGCATTRSVVRLFTAGCKRCVLAAWKADLGTRKVGRPWLGSWTGVPRTSLLNSMGAIKWGTRETCPPFFSDGGEYNMPCPPTFLYLGFVFREVSRQVTFVTFCVKSFSSVPSPRGVWGT